MMVGSISRTRSRIKLLLILPLLLSLDLVLAGIGLNLTKAETDFLPANLYGWGPNYYGQLGDNSQYNDRYTPVRAQQPAAINRFVAVTTSGYHTLGLAEDGTLYAWGINASGELGDGTTTPSLIPVQVHLPEDAPPNFKYTDITASVDRYNNLFSMAVGNDGKIYGWGSNASNILGNDQNSGDFLRPTPAVMPAGVGGDFKFLQVSAGDYHVLATGNDGNVYAWGANQYFDDLGDNTYHDSATPVQTLLPPAVGADFKYVRVGAGGNFSVALGNNGQLYEWGANIYGQLGAHDFTNYPTPDPVEHPVGAPGNLTYTQFSVGAGHVLALGSDGQLYSWGDNTNGDLGIGNIMAKSSPQPVYLPAGEQAVSLAANRFNSAVVTTEGRVYVWGANFYGSLGHSSTLNQSTTPIQVEMPNLATGYRYSLIASNAYSSDFFELFAADPNLSRLDAAAALAGQPDTTFMAIGANFVDGATVLWNGTPMPTTFVDNNQLMFTVPATNLSSAGTVTITVVNPAPGENTTPGLNFPVVPPGMAVTVPEDDGATGTLSQVISLAGDGDTIYLKTSGRVVYLEHPVTLPTGVDLVADCGNPVTFTISPGATPPLSGGLKLSGHHHLEGLKFSGIATNGVGLNLNNSLGNSFRCLVVKS